MSEIIGLIGGSGLGDELEKRLGRVRQVKINTPFGQPSDKILTGTFAGRKVAFINRHGKGHRYNPSVVPYAANIYALKKLGVKSVIASGAVGSLTQKIKPKDIVLVDQVIDKTFKRVNTFFDGIAAVHCEMAHPYCGRLRKALLKVADKVKTKVHSKALYVCMDGPQFSTRGESLVHRKWGGQLIGMTAMPEAKLAREAQMCFALVALISDYDSWQVKNHKTDAQTLLAEIIGNLNSATENAIKLIEAFLRSKQTLCDEDCPCRKSLQLAVWTPEKYISPKYAQILKILRS
ncbi:MAG: S-methyl-5'-thioadenosine phosphorylase [Planctomycetes bacterium HGW-Planctomycetes-1]|nr:MAG: S-methyl-5'-thioadenosine phosphorylase [Planctomycetes bacterium HGW-Planctomycetes-1]